jgi:ABC-type multidrug transport system ATPase subunit
MRPRSLIARKLSTNARETAIVRSDVPPPTDRDPASVVIDVRDLRHAYGDVRAVDGVSFEVRRGEVFALLGPNGAGKTTTVEILEGYRTPDAGTVSVLGFDPRRGGSRYRERIGIVLQASGVYPYMTGREALVLHAGYYPTPRDPAEILELVGMTDHADVLVRKLSGGQLRRLDVGLALVGGPELIFLDEPTTGFDPAARRSFWRVISQLASEGTTILLTTHYMEEATELADRVAVVSEGRIVATGPPGVLATSVMQTTRIAFRPPPGVDDDDLARVAGAPVARGDDLVHLDVPRPTETLYALTAWACERGVELDSLRVAPPTLEDAFLALTAKEPS